MIRWAIVLIYTLSIYAILPFARQWQTVLRDFFGSRFNLILNLFLITLGFLPLWWLARKISRLRLIAFIGIVLISFISLLQMEIPVERIHLLQYGILGYLCAVAVSSSLKGVFAFVCVLVLGTLIGLGDELIQGYLPSRVFDWWDVSYNFAGVFIGSIIFQLVK